MTDPVEIAAAVIGEQLASPLVTLVDEATAVLAALYADGWRLVRIGDVQRLTSGGTHQERAWITEEWTPDE